MLFLTLIWNSITWTMFVMMLRDPQLDWFALLFMIPFITVGAAVAYIAAALLLNVTRIRATPNELFVRHGPLPWFGNRLLDPVTIHQLSSHERVQQGKNGTSRSYDLIAHIIGGGQVTLLSRLDQPSHALFLEQELEAVLAIKDKPMPGEI